jgi:hypothetical protein
VEWNVEYTDECGAWWDGLTAEEQEDINASVILRQRFGPLLRYPHSSSVASSRHSHMRELRVQHAGRPYCLLYAFNPLRTAIPDRLYDEHVQQLTHEGKIPDG